MRFTARHARHLAIIKPMMRPCRVVAGAGAIRSVADSNGVREGTPGIVVAVDKDGDFEVDFQIGLFSSQEALALGHQHGCRCYEQVASPFRVLAGFCWLPLLAVDAQAARCA